MYIAFGPVIVVNSRLFRPPLGGSEDPIDLFHSNRPIRTWCREKRFIRDGNPRQALVYADGACRWNGKPYAAAGYGIVYGPRSYDYGPIERSPHITPTSNRAELRGVLEAIRATEWHAEGFTKLVVASDSAYVVNGITEYCDKWEANGWKNARGDPVANRNLWRKLLEQLDSQGEKGVSVQFWRIPREQNGWADSLAKRGADEYDAESE
jgi:ribonuclease HI